LITIIILKHSESFSIFIDSKGSVVAKIKLVFNPKFTDANETTLETAVKTGKVGELEVDKDSFKVVVEGKKLYSLHAFIFIILYFFRLT
jgi:hypothetical protein